MGGFGSGNFSRLSKRTEVECCLTMSVKDLRRLKALESGTYRSGSIEWHNTVSGTARGSVSYDSDYRDDLPRLHLAFSKHNRAIEQSLTFTETALPWGKTRLWLLCPLCARRIGTLYLPPESSQFGCRTCHNLTYHSSNESHKEKRLINHFATVFEKERARFESLLKQHKC